MARFLEMLQLLDEHGVPEVQVGRRRVESRLHPQRAALLGGRGDLPGELLPGDHLHRAAPQGLENVFHVSLLLISVSVRRNGWICRQLPFDGIDVEKHPGRLRLPRAHLEADGHLEEEPPQDPLRVHPDDRAGGPAHPRVGDVPGPLRQQLGVGGLHVRVRPRDRRDPSVEVEAQRALLGGRLGVEVDEDAAGRLPDRREGTRRPSGTGSRNPPGRPFPARETTA